jgi:hypothetical protein
MQLRSGRVLHALADHSPGPPSGQEVVCAREGGSGACENARTREVRTRMALHAWPTPCRSPHTVLCASIELACHPTCGQCDVCVKSACEQGRELTPRLESEPVESPPPAQNSLLSALFVCGCMDARCSGGCDRVHRELCVKCADEKLREPAKSSVPHRRRAAAADAGAPAAAAAAAVGAEGKTAVGDAAGRTGLRSILSSGAASTAGSITGGCATQRGALRRAAAADAGAPAAAAAAAGGAEGKTAVGDAAGRTGLRSILSSGAASTAGSITGGCATQRGALRRAAAADAAGGDVEDGAGDSGQ